MLHPSITDYIAALENPLGVFRTLGAVEAERDLYGEIALRAGNSAAVFTFRDHDHRRLLKCYIRPNPHLRTIYDWIERHRSSLLPAVRLLRDELWVHSLAGDGGWVDVVEGEWTEGETLAAAVTRAAHARDMERLAELADAFDEVCRTLIAQPWAHGDLKPENIIVRNGDQRTLTLIDCDAMWIPPLAGQRAVELGTPSWRHPARTAARFDKRIDDYPMMLTSASLRALALSPDLWAKYNTPDALLLSPTEVVAGTSAAHTEMLALFAHKGLAREYRMTMDLALPDPEDVDARRFFEVPPAEGVVQPLESFAQRGSWGFRDARGIVAVPPFWDEVLEFRGGEARCRLADEWHTIESDAK